MKFMTVLLGAAAALSLSAFAQDASDEFLAACEAYADDNGVEVNCSCLDEAAQEDEALYEDRHRRACRKHDRHHSHRR